MSKAVLEIEGFVSEPRLGQTKSGKAMASVSVAHTPRKFDKATNEWSDAGETLWVRATFWEELADVVANTIRKGDFVLLRGEPVLRVYEKDGQSQASLELKGAQISVIPRVVRGQGAPGGSSAHSGQGQPVSGAQNDGWHNPGQSFDSADLAPF